jgi:hypothetical protein
MTAKTGEDAVLLGRAIQLVAFERRDRAFGAIRALWRVGDALRELRAETSHGSWRRLLDRCAKELGVHVTTLDDAIRASEAFDGDARASLFDRFANPHTNLTVSHVTELARCHPRLRSRALGFLLSAPRTIRELRAHLRDGCALDGPRVWREIQAKPTG